jgi:hypothetical protein
MTPDPVFDRLDRFTPDASTIDPAAILFRAGRASVRTPWGWKLAVAGLLVTNMVTAFALGFRSLTDRDPIPGPAVVPVVPPALEPTPAPDPTSPPSPWSYAAMMGITDPDQFPLSELVNHMTPAEPPLTARPTRMSGTD